MKKAVGTSLLFFAATSVIGLIRPVQRPDVIMDRTLLSTITVMSALRIFVDIYLPTSLACRKLQKGRGWFVLAMAVYILLMQIT